MTRRLATVALLAVLLPATAAEPLTDDRAAALSRLIRPQADEAKWARVPWLTDLDEARRRSVAEDRPLFVWRAGGGQVLGRA
jgi:hypothetical protein